MYVCVCMYVCAHVNVKCFQRSEDGFRDCGAGVTGGYEPSDVDAGSQVQVLGKNS